MKIPLLVRLWCKRDVPDDARILDALLWGVLGMHGRKHQPKPVVH